MRGHEAEIMELQALMEVWGGEMTYIQCTRARYQINMRLRRVKNTRKCTHADEWQDAEADKSAGGAFGGCMRESKSFRARQDNSHKAPSDRDLCCDHRGYAGCAVGVDPSSAGRGWVVDSNEKG